MSAGALTVFFLIIPTNYLQGLPWEVNALAGAFGAVSWVLHRLAKRGRVYPTAFLGLMVAVITMIWFPNAGIEGGVPFFFLPALTYAVIFFRGRARAVAAVAIVADGLVLMLLEHLHPDWATPFGDVTAMRIDNAAGFATSALLMTIMLWVVTDSYDHEASSRESTLLALDEAREEFARLFQMNPDAVYLVDTSIPAYIDVNHGFERLSGWTKPEAVGRSADQLRLWVNADERTRFYEELSRDGHTQNFLARFRRKDGREFWGSTSANWVEMSGRRLLLLTTRDVTTRIDAQRRDAESRALLAALIDSTSDGVWQVDPQRFAFTAFNAAFVERFRREWGRTPELGQTLDELASPEVGAMWRAFYQRALTEGPFSTEYTYDSGRRVTLVSLSPVTHEGDVFGVSVFSRDITELKRAAEERAAMEQQLLQSQKMESLGSLAGGVAHDYNNMLTAIMGNTELLLDDERDEDRRHSLLAILHAATRSKELTGKLLAFGRRGKNIVQAVDLSSIVKDSLAILRPSFRADLQIVADIRAAWTVDGDPSQMSQVIVNLCINANEAMPAGGTLHVSTADIALGSAVARRAALPPGDYVMLQVRDSGIGMTEEVQARIFEPFFTTKVGGQVRGTGLGLSTVYGIIQSHGGNISVESSPGQGASFTVYLPKGHLNPERPSAAPTLASGTGVILVAEDEDMVRDLLVSAITGLGYKPLVAIDGDDAVRVFKEHHATLVGVILDLRMPRKTGAQAFADMRAIDPHVPVLVCSGYGENEEAQRLITLGARGLLAKPFTIADLSAHLARMARRI
mgnify:FL=1